MAILSRASIASNYIRHFREVLPDIPIAFDTVDLHFLREQRRADLSPMGGKVKGVLATRELELALVRSADSTIVVSDYEKQVLEELVPNAQVFVLPTTHESVPSDGSAERVNITFVGSFQHDPNGDAIRWFVENIFPLVSAQIPAAHLVVVGKNPPADVVAIAPLQVRFLGWVEDLEPIHASTRVSVAPLRYGAGVKGKVGEAWAHGVPVVMTSLAAEGMQVEPGVTALIADDAQTFADAVVRLYRDEPLWQSVSDAGRLHVEKTFGKARFQELIGAVIDHAVRLA